MMAPTIGRIVHYYPGIADLTPNGDQPMAAIIASVWSDRLVNLMVIDASGIPVNRTSIRLVQAGDPPPRDGESCCMWPALRAEQAAA